MRKLLAPNQQNQNLKQIHMLDLTFYPSNLKAINEHALRIVKNENDKDGLVRSMQILFQNNKNSLSSLKTLIFLNLVQRNYIKLKKQMNQEVYKSINIVLRKQRTRLDKYQSSRQTKRRRSVIKTVDWLKDLFNFHTNNMGNKDINCQHIRSRQSISESLDRKQNKMVSINQNRGEDQHRTQIRCNTQCQPGIINQIRRENWNQTGFCFGSNRLNSIQNNIPQIGSACCNKNNRDGTRIKTQQWTSVQLISRQQFIIKKLIEPYCSYLLKLYSAQHILINTNPMGLQTVQLWKLVNMLKYIFNISEVFPTIFRYYSDHYSEVVYYFLKIIDYEIKLSYPLLQKSLSPRLSILTLQMSNIQAAINAKSKILKSNGSVSSKRRSIVHERQVSGGLKKQEHELYKQLGQKCEINELKQIVKQISSVNEHINNIYLCKYTQEGIARMGLQYPNLLQQSKFNVVHQLCHILQKSTSRSLDTNKSMSIKGKNDNKNNLKSTQDQKQMVKSNSRTNCALYDNIIINIDDVQVQKASDNYKDTFNSTSTRCNSQTKYSSSIICKNRIKNKSKCGEDGSLTKGQNLCMFKKMRMKAIINSHNDIESLKAPYDCNPALQLNRRLRL